MPTTGGSRGPSGIRLSSHQIRDIDQLSAAGIPVIADRGCTGGFKLADGFRTQLTGLTESEAETLFLAGLPGPMAELGLADLMAVARTKLMAALPAGARAERLATRFHLDAAGWFRATDAVTLLPTIARALWNGRYLSFRYGDAKDVDVRKVGPIGLVLKAGIWYLVAQKGNSFRTYRVGKISAAEALDEPYVRPPKFDLAGWWARSSREYEVSSYGNSAIIRLSPRPFASGSAGSIRRGSGGEDRQRARCTRLGPLHNSIGVGGARHS